MDKKSNQEKIIASTRAWLEQFVVGMNLCPFAAGELTANRVSFWVSTARDELSLLNDLDAAFNRMYEDPDIGTAMLIHPDVLRDFEKYNQFLELADETLLLSGFEGDIQIASFHPGYRFSGTQADAAENYSNRSPYPMLHLLREEQVELAVEQHGDTEQIPKRNIEHLRKLGSSELERLWQSCFTKD